MRILWISFFGTWTVPLLKEITKNNTVALIYPTNCDDQITEHGATIYKINATESELTTAMSSVIFQKYEFIIRNFKPDIIHVHGTEKNLAQIQNYIHDIPVVISIQGIMAGYIPFDCGYVTSHDISSFKTMKNLIGRGGRKSMHRRFMKGTEQYEKDILTHGRYFFCRTNWDKAWVSFSSPQAKIYQGEELLRQPFYDNMGIWRYDKSTKHTIFMPSGFNPIKGLHIALKVTALLKKFFPDVKLIVPGLPKHILEYSGIKKKILGEEYVSYCKNIIQKNNIEDNVSFFEKLSAEEMVHEMRKANVFLCPSSIENSSNVVGEATMIGMPIVCTPVGGLTTFMKDEQNCLFAPAGDEYITAYQIKRLFDDSELASQLGKTANATALIRHDKKAALCQYLTAYKDIIHDFTTRK